MTLYEAPIFSETATTASNYVWDGENWVYKRSMGKSQIYLRNLWNGLARSPCPFFCP
jgi:hypothetical protein